MEKSARLSCVFQISYTDCSFADLQEESKAITLAHSCLRKFPSLLQITIRTPALCISLILSRSLSLRRTSCSKFMPSWCSISFMSHSMLTQIKFTRIHASTRASLQDITQVQTQMMPTWALSRPSVSAGADPRIFSAATKSAQNFKPPRSRTQASDQSL